MEMDMNLKNLLTVGGSRLEALGWIGSCFLDGNRLPHVGCLMSSLLFVFSPSSHQEENAPYMCLLSIRLALSGYFTNHILHPTFSETFRNLSAYGRFF